MNMTGSWYNPQYAGEGIAIFDAPFGGTVVAHFFGYNADGSQLWLTAHGDRSTTGAELAAVSTRGPLGSVIESHWGLIVISDEPYLGLYPANGPSRRYSLTTRLDFSNTIPDTPDVPQPSTVIVIRNKLGAVTGVPCDGSTTKSGDTFTLEVVNGTLTITDIVADKLFRPRMEGIKKGEVLTEDSPIREVTFMLDPGWEQVGGQYDVSGLTVHTRELGPIFNLSAQVRRP